MMNMDVRVRPNTTSRCECGNAKGTHTKACARCLALDGRGQLERWIIDQLRGESGPLGLAELTDRRADRNVRDARWLSARRSIHRALSRMVDDGRVEKRELSKRNRHTAWGNPCESTLREFGYVLKWLREVEL